MQIVHFTPPEISRMLGVNESTVKRWIDRGLLRAVRTPGGHRRIREEDLRSFMATQDTARKHSYVLSRYAKQSTLAGSWKKYFTLHLKREPQKAREFLTASFITQNAVQDILEHIIAPTLVAIGEGWRKGTLDIVDEHRMTFLIRADLLALETLLPHAPRSAPHIVFACVPEENHELTLVLLALLAREQGWRTTVLGINVPAQEIERECATSQPSVVALAKVYREAAGLDYVRTVRSLPALDTVPILVGGKGWTTSEQTHLGELDSVSCIQTLGEFVSALTTISKHTKRGGTHTQHKRKTHA